MINRKLRYVLDNFGINLTKTSQVLGLTKYSEIKNLLNRLRPNVINSNLIRVGGIGDGGYVIPDDLEGISACFSPGSAGYWKFEKELWEKYNIPSYICDVEEEKPNDLNDAQIFDIGWVGPANSKGFFTLDDWVKKHGHLDGKGDLILQMDIEGAEYLTLLSISDQLLSKFRIMVIEFHHFEAIRNLHAFTLVYKPLFDRLLSHFDVAHIHPNNCCGEWWHSDLRFPVIFELTLIRKDRSQFLKMQSSKYENLDSPNDPNKKDLIIQWPKLMS